MRGVLLFFGWASFVGSIVDGAIAVFALWIIVSASEPLFAMTVDQHLREHLHFIYWVKQVGYFVLPDGFVNWLFALPALVAFPVRVVASAALGGWALSVAKRMK